MEFSDVIRRQRMTRRFERRPVPRDLVDAILAAGQKAPSAGFSQGVNMIVLEGEQSGIFWQLVDPQRRRPAAARAPVVVLPAYSKAVYLRRYSEADKAASGLGAEEKWPAPFWLIDCAFATMAILLAATAAGLGCWFLGIFTGEQELKDELGISPEHELIGAIALGYPAERDVRSRSLRRGRKPLAEFIVRPGREAAAGKQNSS